MCGIAGILHSDDQPLDRMLLDRMNATLWHRGPDGDGFHVEPGLGLAHCRLSIIDLSGGGQPLSNETGEIWITFNGEIYNYQELRDLLMARGHRMATASDTEVIVHAYEEFGESCVAHLHGMFAFAIWDAPRKQLFVARDRVGIKPLYYSLDERQYLFASELKAIYANRGTGALDPLALQDYFLYGYIPHTRTIFNGFHKLLPGHSMMVRRNSLTGKLTATISQYWDLHFEPAADVSEEDWLAEFRHVLSETVKLHLISDVPLGAFLSGGLDSSCVVAVMSRLNDVPVKTFSIGFQEEDFSELIYARQMADRYHTEHHELIVRPDAIDLLPVLARQFDEPFGDSSAIPTLLVSKLARQHVTVSLSGDGGDELFGGYRRYADTLAVRERQRRLEFLPQGLRKALFGSLASALPDGTRGSGSLRRLGMSPFETYMNVAYWHAPSFVADLFDPDFAALIPNGQGDVFQNYFASTAGHDELTRMQYLDTKTYLPEDILAKVDRTSMLQSLEARVPLLDHKLMEFVARIPARLKFRNGQGKYLFKRFLKDLLPPALLNRPKMGFGVPLVHWFKSDLEGYARDILFSKRSRERGYFNQAFVDRLLVEHSRGRSDHSQDIWRLLVFEHWCQSYLDTSSERPPKSSEIVYRSS